MYLLTCSNEERAEEIRKQNNEALKSIEGWAISRKEFYDSLPSQQVADVDLKTFYDNYSEFVDPQTGKIFTGKGTVGTSIKQLSDKLTKSKVLVIQKFNQLNTNYKLLSLTEHYHPVTRRHSYNLDVDKFIYLDFAKWMKLSVNILTQIIDECFLFQRSKKEISLITNPNKSIRVMNPISHNPILTFVLLQHPPCRCHAPSM